MSILTNPILSTDSYKLSHFAQYPKGTERVFSYIEARGSKIPGVSEVVMFGLQPYLMKLDQIRVTQAHVDEASEFAEAHGEPFNRAGWERIVNVHGGRLPVEIYAVPEGTPVPIGVPMVAVFNSDPELAWLTSYLETDILRAVWYGSTVATLSRECKRIIKAALDKSSEAPDAELPFKLHDFGFRGVSSFESASIGGAAHLVNFMGTDTIAGIGYADEYYQSGVCGFSIPAAEHSTMTMRGRFGEKDSYQAMIDAYAKPGAIFAVVSDSYDLFNAVENIWIGGGLFDQVKERGATVVIRPDSGDPLTVPVEVIKLIAEKYGYTVNSKGYKVLPDHVRVIQGDGITIDSLPVILRNLLDAGFSASNIAFGMGGGLLQQVNRDTFKFAMKASAAEIDGSWYDVFKDPVTDTGKKSKRGIVGAERLNNAGMVRTAVFDDLREFARGRNILRRVYGAENGVEAIYSFGLVRSNASL